MESLKGFGSRRPQIIIAELVRNRIFYTDFPKKP